jgi:hypothetical protein
MEVTTLKKGEIFKSKELDLLGPSFEGRSYIIDDFIVVPSSKNSISIVRVYLKTIMGE